jgi:hypothetical protein
MQRFEFKVIPAPKRGEKARGVKTTEDRFAFALTNLMNQLGAEGWDYVRADALPCEERVGFTGSKTTFQNVLVFRRIIPGTAVEAPDPAGSGPSHPTPWPGRRTCPRQRPGCRTRKARSRGRIVSRQPSGRPAAFL